MSKFTEGAKAAGTAVWGAGERAGVWCSLHRSFTPCNLAIAFLGGLVLGLVLAF